MIIERSSDLYWTYTDIEGTLISGGGETIEQCKQDVLDCIETLKTLGIKNRPKFLNDDYEIVYEFDREIEK